MCSSCVHAHCSPPCPPLLTNKLTHVLRGPAACSAGTYQPDKTKSTCLQCPRGTSNNLLAQTSCAGTSHRKNKPSSVNSGLCRFGSYFLVTNSFSFSDCEPGKYQDSTGQAACKDPGYGYITTQVGSGGTSRKQVSDNRQHLGRASGILLVRLTHYLWSWRVSVVQHHRQ